MLAEAAADALALGLRQDVGVAEECHVLDVLDGERLPRREGGDPVAQIPADRLGQPA